MTCWSSKILIWGWICSLKVYLAKNWHFIYLFWNSLELSISMFVFSACDPWQERDYHRDGGTSRDDCGLEFCAARATREAGDWYENGDGEKVWFLFRPNAIECGYATVTAVVKCVKI